MQVKPEAGLAGDLLSPEVMQQMSQVMTTPLLATAAFLPETPQTGFAALNYGCHAQC